MSKDTLRQSANILTVIIALAVNILSNALPLDDDGLVRQDAAGIGIEEPSGTDRGDRRRRRGRRLSRSRRRRAR